MSVHFSRHRAMLPGRGSTHLITAAVPVPVTGLAHPGSSTSSESAERQAPGRSGGHGADETLLTVAFQSLFPHLAESSIKNITSFLMDQGVQNRSQVLDVFRVRAGEALLERASQPSSGLRLIDLAELGKASRWPTVSMRHVVVTSHLMHRLRDLSPLRTVMSQPMEWQ